MTTRSKGILSVLSAAALFSTSGVLIKMVSANAMTVACLRSGIGALAMIPFIQWKRIFKTLRGKALRDFLLMAASYILLTLCFVNATKMTTAANAVILQSAAPLWLYLYYLIAGKQKISFKTMWPRIAILLGMIIILIDPSNLSQTSIALAGLVGIGLAVFSGICYAFEQHYMEKDYPMNDLSKIGLLNILMFIVSLTVFWNQINIVGLPVTDYLMLGFLGVFQNSLPYALLFAGIPVVSAFESSVLVMLEPILNPILVAVFIGEIPTIYTCIGYVFIFGGIVITLINGKKAVS